MCLDFGLEGGSAGIKAYPGDGTDRGEEEGWKMEFETAQEIARTYNTESSLGLSAGRNGLSIILMQYYPNNVQEWMRTDFAEERRWKVVMAREFAYQAVEWHLSNTESKASRMVGGRGWGKCNDVPIPGHPGIRMDMDELPLRGSAEDVVEMLVGQADPEDGFTAEQDGAVGMDATGAEVLEDILPKSPGENADTAGPLEPIARRKGVDEDITMRGDALAGDGMPQSDDMGELDAAPELDAVGELDAIGAGDLDAEGEADVSEVGVVGLEGEQCSSA